MQDSEETEHFSRKSFPENGAKCKSVFTTAKTGYFGDIVNIKYLLSTMIAELREECGTLNEKALSRNHQIEYLKETLDLVEKDQPCETMTRQIFLESIETTNHLLRKHFKRDLEDLKRELKTFKGDISTLKNNIDRNDSEKHVLPCNCDNITGKANKQTCVPTNSCGRGPDLDMGKVLGHYIRMQQKNHEKRKEINIIVAGYEILKEQMRSEKEKNRDLESHKTQLATELFQLKEQLRHNTEVSKAFEKKYRTCSNSVAALQEELNQATKQLEETRNRELQLEVDICNVKSSAKNVQAALHEEIEQIKFESNEYRAKMTEFCEKQKRLLDIVHDKLGQFSQIHEQTRASADALNQSIAELQLFEFESN